MLLPRSSNFSSVSRRPSARALRISRKEAARSSWVASLDRPVPARSSPRCTFSRPLAYRPWRRATADSTGLTASALGLVEVATRLARDLVAAVEASGVTEVFVLRPADKWAFEYVYPTRLGVEWPSNVAITEVTVVLARVVEKGGLKLSRRDAAPPAYHDPCHSPRIARDATAPRRLLAAIYGDQPAPELFWRAHRAHPCGAVGGLDVTHPDIARQLTAARIEGALSAGATTLVTDDPVCLGELRRHAQDRLDVVGLFTLLARTS